VQRCSSPQLSSTLLQTPEKWPIVVHCGISAGAELLNYAATLPKRLAISVHKGTVLLEKPYIITDASDTHVTPTTRQGCTKCCGAAEGPEHELLCL
jgi:hypothetical protein